MEKITYKNNFLYLFFYQLFYMVARQVFTIGDIDANKIIGSLTYKSVRTNSCKKV